MKVETVNDKIVYTPLSIYCPIPFGQTGTYAHDDQRDKIKYKFYMNGIKTLLSNNHRTRDFEGPFPNELFPFLKGSTSQTEWNDAYDMDSTRVSYKKDINSMKLFYNSLRPMVDIQIFEFEKDDVLNFKIT